jgi:lysophospholipase L1-like esterase
VTLALPGDPDQPAVIYLPEGMRPVVTQVQPVGGSLRPAPRQPRLLVVGDHVTQGWLAASPATSWPAVIGRKLGLDVGNLGFAGTTRLEAVVGLTVAATPAEAVVVSVGTGCWSRPAHSAALLAESLRSFLDLVRAGHPTAPLVVVSPLLRPAAEDVPNVFGATLADLRRAVEDVVMERSATDPALVLVPGEPVLGEEELADGVYPGDEGHRRVAAAVSKVLSPRGQELRMAALSRWQEEVMAQTPAFAGQLAATVPGASRPVPPTGAGHAPRPAGGGGGTRAAAPPAGPGDDAEVPEAITAAARASAAAAKAYAASTGRAVATTAG